MTRRHRMLLFSPLAILGIALFAFAVDVTLAPAADLQVTSVTAPEHAVRGQTLPVTFTVTNAGSADTPSGNATWNDRVYLSADPLLDTAADRFLGDVPHTGVVAANGGSYTVSTELRLPRDLTGAYYVFVLADPAALPTLPRGIVFEGGFENNNSTAAPLPVLIERPPPSDLVVDSITTPATGAVNDSITVAFTVRNASGTTAQGSWSDSVYLSADSSWDLDDVLLGKVVHTGDLAVLDVGVDLGGARRHHRQHHLVLGRGSGSPSVLVVERRGCRRVVAQGRERQHRLRLRAERDAVVEVEVALERGDPMEAPAHSLLVRGELGERRARHRDHRDVARLEVDDVCVEAVRPERAVRAAFVPGRIEHEVVDEELAAAVEEAGERLLAVGAVENVFLVDGLPWEVTALPAQVVAEPCELLLLDQQRLAGVDPFVMAHNCVLFRHEASFAHQSVER